ncbi:hypothetical protein QBC40DRAFT_252955 [Triangularia verruculosa]|uniref:Uncharacterized protein n=1 Tax=Triangularia verruculosa TaxID=2587418 RepID=A0AAN7AWI7_9PEZI|nr:hypothetical protein QBC40DRAFT_252955 [Triangularia verruculosa]
MSPTDAAGVALGAGAPPPPPPGHGGTGHVPQSLIYLGNEQSEEDDSEEYEWEEDKSEEHSVAPPPKHDKKSLLSSTVTNKAGGSSSADKSAKAKGNEKASKKKTELYCDFVDPVTGKRCERKKPFTRNNNLIRHKVRFHHRKHRDRAQWALDVRAESKENKLRKGTGASRFAAGKPLSEQPQSQQLPGLGENMGHIDPGRPQSPLPTPRQLLGQQRVNEWLSQGHDDFWHIDAWVGLDYEPYDGPSWETEHGRGQPDDTEQPTPINEGPEETYHEADEIEMTPQEYPPVPTDGKWAYTVPHSEPRPGRDEESGSEQ